MYFKVFKCFYELTTLITVELCNRQNDEILIYRWCSGRKRTGRLSALRDKRGTSRATTGKPQALLLVLIVPSAIADITRVQTRVQT